MGVGLIGARRVGQGWRERLGLDLAPVAPGALWLAAASVGEVGLAEALLPHLSGPILLTVDTANGRRAAQRLAQARADLAIAQTPLDVPWLLAPLWAEARPRGLVFLDDLYWPMLARTALSAATAVLRVGVRVGPGTRRSGAAHGWLTRGVTAVWARDLQAASWLRAHQAAPVTVGGELKADRRAGASRFRFAQAPWVGASTRPGDEAALLDAWSAAGAAWPLVLAPRHLERSPALAREVKERGLPLRRASTSDPAGAEVSGRQVLLLDTYGELFALLPKARAVFLGGTFDPRLGGHSPAEAHAAGAPLVVGPHHGEHAASVQAAGAEVANGPADLLRALRAAKPPPAPPRPFAREAAAWIEAHLTEPGRELAPRPWARPLVPLVRAVRSARRGWEGWRAEAAAVPVLAVGSNSARGSGKTTVARWVAACLARRGLRVGVVVRGVGRLRGSGTTLAEQLGDEGALFARDGHLVATGGWARAARELIDRGAEVLVLDDGLDQQALAAQLTVSVRDGRFPLARGPLPVGEERPGHRAEVADLRLVVDGQWPGATSVRRALGPWRQGEAFGDGPAGPVALVSGLGRPGDAARGLTVARYRAWPDHQPLRAPEAEALLRWAEPWPLVITAKDYVRWPPALAPRVHWRDVRLEVPAGLEDLLWSQVQARCSPRLDGRTGEDPRGEG